MRTTDSTSRFHTIAKTKYPIVQAGMVWVSGGKLASAAANSGIVGLIGAGSMKPALLSQHIEKAKSLLIRPELLGNLGVNIPLLYPGSKEQIDISLKRGIRLFFTSAGSPKKFTGYLKDHGARVVHVTSSPELAIKCENAGVDAVVGEGFEAGGHNGPDELTTLILIPQMVDAVSIPVIAAGGIMGGRSIMAAMGLGACGVQMGTRFITAKESSAHENFQKHMLESKRSSATKLLMKGLVPVRLLANDFSRQVEELEKKGASAEQLKELLGKGRAKKGMLLGDISEGELEVGQGVSMLKKVQSVQEIVEEVAMEYRKAYEKLAQNLAT